jgi:iron complex outermembrane receptor protein
MNSIFTFHIHQFEIGIHSNYVGKQFIDNTSDSERVINPYFVNNINLNYSLPLGKIKKIQLQLLVNNVFNEKYETNAYTLYSCYVGDERYNELRYFPQAGTNFLTSVRLKF